MGFFFCPVPKYFSSFEIQKIIESNLNPQSLPFNWPSSNFYFFLGLYLPVLFCFFDMRLTLYLLCV